jgi:tetratricopeptide (TPR) repeat protein
MISRFRRAPAIVKPSVRWLIRVQSARRRWRASLPLLVALGISFSPASASQSGNEQGNPETGRWSSLESARRQQPGGNHRLASLDAYLEGNAQWDAGAHGAALESWRRASRFDLDFLPPRLRLIQGNLFRDFPAAAQWTRECLDILQRDFPFQRWLIRHAMLGTCIALTLGSLAFLLGLLVRHARALHHTVQETLSYALRMARGPAVVLAAVVLCLPFLSNLGILVSLLFLVFLASYRFGRGERALALVATTWIAILGPLLVVSAPWWSSAPDGRDSGLIAAAQQHPISPALRSHIRQWVPRENNPAVAHYLEGLARKVDRDPFGAVDYYNQSSRSGDVPPWVVETNVGNALLMAGQPEQAMVHYRRAIEIEPSAFEPHYDLALAQARRGEYILADAEFERASRIDLNRMRALTRTGDRFEPSSSVDALWTASDLWAYTLRHPGPDVPPRLLSGLLPLRSPLWTAPIVIFAVFAGLSAGRWMRRLIRVHECYQCGGPVCRRCLARLDRRAYCHRCAEALGGMSSGEATRLLLRRLLEEKPAWSAQLVRALAPFVPGVGPASFGSPGTAFLSGSIAGASCALLTYPIWGESILNGPWADPLGAWIRSLGVLTLLISIVASAAGVRHARHRAATLQAFLSRDVDRLAA